MNDKVKSRNDRNELEDQILDLRDQLKTLKRRSAPQDEILESQSRIVRLTSRLLTLDNFKPIDIPINSEYKVFSIEELQAQDKLEEDKSSK